MRLLKPITGLVFAIDFRHNGKDAWYRTAGSLVGTLAGAAAVSGGGLVVGATGDSLNFNLTAAQTPSTVGAVLMDQTFAGANDGVLDDFLFSASPSGQPASPSGINRVFVVRLESGSDGALLGRVYSADGGSSLSAPTTIDANSSARRNGARAGNGCDGSVGAANIYLSVDGGTPVSTLAQTLTRNA